MHLDQSFYRSDWTGKQSVHICLLRSTDAAGLIRRKSCKSQFWHVQLIFWWSCGPFFTPGYTARVGLALQWIVAHVHSLNVKNVKFPDSLCSALFESRTFCFDTKRRTHSTTFSHFTSTHELVYIESAQPNFSIMAEWHVHHHIHTWVRNNLSHPFLTATDSLTLYSCSLVTQSFQGYCISSDGARNSLCNSEGQEGSHMVPSKRIDVLSNVCSSQAAFCWSP